MTASLFVAIAALAVSLAIGSATLYQQFLKRPRIAVIPGEELYFAYGRDYAHLEIAVGVSLVNLGAFDAIITRIDGSIVKEPREWEIPFSWSHYVESDARPGTWQSSWAFKGHARPFIAPARGASFSWIYCYGSPNESRLVAGWFTLSVTVHLGGSQRKKFSTMARFVLDEEMVTRLETACVEAPDGSLTDSLRVTLVGAETPDR